MYIVVPEEKQKLERIFKPYLDGVKLKTDAPQEAKDAYEAFYKWFNEEIERIE